MTKELNYVYLGTNGTITSPVFLEGAMCVKKYLLIAENGKRLTKDGENLYFTILVPEDEVDLWKEVDGQNP